jgi:hypothetical protein
MRTESDERMAKLKAAISRCHEDDMSALRGCEITRAELMTIRVLAKAAGDAFTYEVTTRLLTAKR